MKALTWNYRGLGNPLTVDTLQDWCWRECPNIVFLMEAMLADYDLMKICNRRGFNNGVRLSNKGCSGGMGFWWDNLDVYILSYDNQHFFAEVLENDKPM